MSLSFNGFLAQDSQDPIGERVVEAEQFRQGDFANAVSNVSPQALVGAEGRLKEAGLWGLVLHLDLLDPKDALLIQRQLEENFSTPTYQSEEAVLWVL